MLGLAEDAIKEKEKLMRQTVMNFALTYLSHITTHILLQLPFKSLLICRCVCKIWKTVISESDFAKLHFERSPISLMIRTHDKNRVSRTLHLLECDPEKFEIRSNNQVKLDPIFKLPLRDAKSLREKRDKIKIKSNCPLRAARLVSDKNVESSNRGTQSLYITCNRDYDKFNM